MTRGSDREWSLQGLPCFMMRLHWPYLLGYLCSFGSSPMPGQCGRSVNDSGYFNICSPKRGSLFIARVVGAGLWSETTSDMSGSWSAFPRSQISPTYYLCRLSPREQGCSQVTPHNFTAFRGLQPFQSCPH